MIPGPRSAFLQREPVQPGGVEQMRGRPAVLTIADVRRDALRAGYSDQGGDETLFYRVMDLRQAHHRDASSALQECDRRRL
jgi:hypothetical protein